MFIIYIMELKSVPYGTLEKSMRPFDLLFYKSNSPVGYIIAYFTANVCSNIQKVIFTHVGMVVSSQILDIPNLDPNKLYNYEMNGIMKIKDLESSLRTCISQRHIVVWGKLRNNPIDHMDIDTVKSKFTDIYKKYDGARFDRNYIDVISMFYSCTRPYRMSINNLLNKPTRITCSGIVTVILKEFGVIPQNVDHRNVLPYDLAYENHHEFIPCLIEQFFVILNK